MSGHFSLPIPDDFRRPLAAAWLLIGVSALAISGLFVVLIVLSRTPGVEALFPLQGFFHMAIVAHVDFSVLIWFAACAAMFWTLCSQARNPLLAIGGLALVVTGSVLMAMGPFYGGAAIMSNYVPVLVNPQFLGGLAVFAIGFVLLATHALAYPLPVGTPLTPAGVLRFGSHTSVIAVLLAAGALVWSMLAIPDFLQGQAYYETLFWGGGHVLQFAWVQLMLVAWLWLASAAGVRIPLTPRFILMLLLIGIAPAFLAVWGYLSFDVAGPQHRQFFIWLMAAAGGLAAGPIGLALLIGLWHTPSSPDRHTRGLRAALLLSIYLFGIGGALGFLIGDSNTMVPAHYHGCIVAVTLTFMVIGLHLMPQLGLGHVKPGLMLALPWIYGVGQLLHVAGLAFSGGHGVQRKTAGADQALDSIAQILGMAVMGIGGLIAIVGGVLFIVAVVGALRSRARPVPEHAARAFVPHVHEAVRGEGR
jgi:cytochrome c oxidase subunit I